MSRSTWEDELEDVELALLRVIRFWDLAARHPGNRHALGMAAVDKVHLEQGGSTADWHQLKRAMPVAMETLVVGGFLDDEAGVVTPRGIATLDR